MKRSAIAMPSPREQACVGSRGFTLIELMVAMMIFLVIAGTAFSVFDQHMQMISHQEGLSGVNLALRNATSQLQMDLAGAGQNLLSGAGQNVPTELGDFATGVVIQNNVSSAQGGTAAACTPSASYAYPVPSACFDSLTIFGPQNVGCAATTNGQPPVLAISDSATENLSSDSTIQAVDPATGASLATDQGCFKAGDELVIVEPANGGTTPCGFTWCLTTVTLTANATNNGTDLLLTHTLTAASGAPSGCPGSSCTDPQGVLNNPNALTGYNFDKAIYSSFTSPPSAPSTYVVDIGSSSADISYSVVVNPSNSSDNQLQRCTSTGCAVLADQVIGFKVGAALWSNESDGQPDIANYFYDSSKYCYDPTLTVNCNAVPVPVTGYDPYDFALVRAVRVSLIGRTTPSTDPSLAKFTNGFDNGPYLVQQASVVVDLRNMSIGDFQN